MRSRVWQSEYGRRQERDLSARRSVCVADGALSMQQALNEFSSECAQSAARFVSSHCFVSHGQLQGDDRVSIEKTRNFFHQLQYSTRKAAGMSDRARKAHFALVRDRRCPPN